VYKRSSLFSRGVSDEEKKTFYNNDCRGRGIFIVNHPNQVPLDEPMVYFVHFGFKEVNTSKSNSKLFFFQGFIIQFYDFFTEFNEI
jgi:hypothetical protein